MIMLLVVVTACNLNSEPPTTPAPLAGANASVELIEQATNTPNALPTATAIVRPIPITQTITGIVWHDVCDAPDSEVDETPLGCIEAEGYQANGILEVGEAGLAEVVVSLGEGACPSDELAESVTNAAGIYTFDNLESATYCVSINTLRPENLALLIPGSWTAPNTDGALTVTLAAGESKLDADFGWDFQFSP